jgi:toxic protein SymE
VSAINTHRPLTTTNSSKELTMADANHKARPPVTQRFVTIQQSRRYQEWKPGPYKEAPLFPWMKLAGKWIEHAGFEAGQRVKIAVEHGRLIITAE